MDKRQAESLRITALKAGSHDYHFQVTIDIDGVELTLLAHKVEFEHRGVCPIMGPRRFVTRAED